MSPQSREEYDKWNEGQYNASLEEQPEDEDYESDDSNTQRMKRLQWINENRKKQKDYFVIF